VGADGDSQFRAIHYRRGVTTGPVIFRVMHSTQTDQRPNLFQTINLKQVADTEGTAVVRMTILMSSIVTVRRRSIRSAHRLNG
jgi:hypothetical protein